MDADATGRCDDEWSLASFDVRSIASSDDNFDVLSVASSSAISSHSRYSASSTAVFGDHLHADTASTAGAVLPLAAVRFISRRVVEDDNQSYDDGASLVSVNTRRGWPRVSTRGAGPTQPALPERGSYRDVLLREPDAQRHPLHTQGSGSGSGSGGGGGSSGSGGSRPDTAAAAAAAGWTTLRPKKLRARIRALAAENPLAPLAEGDEEVLVRQAGLAPISPSLDEGEGFEEVQMP